jgi:hypothetical protein
VQYVCTLFRNVSPAWQTDTGFFEGFKLNDLG